MRVGWRTAVAIGCALGAAVLWGVDLARWQPVLEFGIGQNNTYWARDLRFSAIVAIVLAVLLAGRGTRLSRWAGPAVGIGWIGADLAIDRAGIEGGGVAVALAAAGAAVAVAAAVLVSRRAEGEPGRRTLTVSAAIAAALTPLVAGIESPTDTEAALTPAAVSLGAVLATLTVALALTTAPRRAYAVAVVVGFVAVVGLVLCRVLDPGNRLAPMMLLGTALLAGVALLTGDLPRGALEVLRHLPKLLVLLVLYPAVVLFMVLATAYLVPVPAWLTALSGNAPVNAADSDTLYALVGVATGYVIGWLLLAIDRAFVPPPVPAEEPPSRVSAGHALD
ncbi:hypothetical protein O7635_27145 [Asanoa sp. WMMD1127]|uniref:hypothetical protein n=1 Tax=Asanoa sp. WMMD1127 TaxID=3016107 RepID=UPI0024179107|nr:hypothetical protein [Asanoa sp. WMMD1127]MDG4825541.1 hypothetical protein [Asanoa sp. WMMD1127]